MPNHQKLAKQIEAVLFYRAEPVSAAELSTLLEVNEDEIHATLEVLHEVLRDRGITLIGNEGKVMLGTSPEEHPLIEKVRGKELSAKLGRSGLECLALVCYRGPVTQAQVSEVRGVNSQFILRRLATRGLIEPVEGSDSRKKHYRATTKLLAHLGLQQLNELPEYEKVGEYFDEQESHQKQSDSPKEGHNNFS